MNDGLLDAFRHNAWATGELLRVCQTLTESQLEMSAPGTYGSIIATLRHLASAEAGYYARLTGEEPGWDRRADPPPTLDDLIVHTASLAARWEQFLAQPFDAEPTSPVGWPDGYTYDVPAGVVLAQALHHGNEHRAHICTVLSVIGVTTPDLGVWNFAEAAQRAKRREP